MVSLVIDDLKSIDPWNPRFVKIMGKQRSWNTTVFSARGNTRITLKKSWSGGIDGLPLKKDEWRLETIHEKKNSVKKEELERSRVQIDSF